MTTYTIAYQDMLYATVPDGEDVIAAAADYARDAGIAEEFDAAELAIVPGVTLTNEPLDGDEVVYSGTEMGYLTDETGQHYQFAVLRDRTL